MSCRDIRARLDDFVDGELPKRQRETVQRHLTDCSACRREEEELRSLLAAARRLPGLAPDLDLWNGIEARLHSERWTARLGRLGPPRRLVQPLLMAAAVVALVALSIPLVRQQLAPPGGPVAAAPAQDEIGDTAALAELARLEDGTLTPRRDLLEAIELDRAVLAPATLATVESNIREIDAAIGEIRAALEAHPDNPHLSRLLAARYQQEVVLLKQLKRV